MARTANSSTTNSGGTAAGAKPRRRDLQKRIEELIAQMERLSAENERLQRDTTRNSSDTDPGDVILRPTGSAGDGFNLQHKMGLDDDPDKYKSIQRAVKTLIGHARLDHRKHWRAQSCEDVVKLYRIARKSHPYLRRFANDWATEELAKQYLKNHRAYYRRKGYDLNGEGGDQAGDAGSEEDGTE